MVVGCGGAGPTTVWHRGCERLGFCSRERQKHLEYSFAWMGAFQPFCFQLFLPKRRQTPLLLLESWRNGLQPPNISIQALFSTSLPSTATSQALLFPHPSFFYLPSVNTSFIIPCTSQVNDCHPHSLPLYICCRLQFGHIFRCLFEGCLKTLITTVSPSLR